MKDPNPADDPGPVPPELPLSIVPEFFEQRVQISESRYFKVRGFADKPRFDLVLVEGKHETLMLTINVCDAVNVAWLIETGCRAIGAAHQKWREERADPDLQAAREAGL